MAHLLEHLIIDRQVAIAEEIHSVGDNLLDAVYAGTTERVGEREFVISLNFKDDLIALRALNDAIRIIDEAVSSDVSGQRDNQEQR